MAAPIWRRLMALRPWLDIRLGKFLKLRAPGFKAQARSRTWGPYPIREKPKCQPHSRKEILVNFPDFLPGRSGNWKEFRRRYPFYKEPSPLCARHVNVTSVNLSLLFEASSSFSEGLRGLVEEGLKFFLQNVLVCTREESQMRSWYHPTTTLYLKFLYELCSSITYYPP